MMHAKLNRNALGRREHGFTLLETMVTLTIAGIMSALAVPSFQQMYAKFELYQAATTLQHRMMMAQKNAVRLNTVIAAVPSIGPTGAWQLTVTPPVPGELFPRSVGFILPPVPPTPPIGFNGRGMSITPLGPVPTFVLVSNPYPTVMHTVSVYPSGRVTMCRRQAVPCP